MKKIFAVLLTSIILAGCTQTLPSQSTESSPVVLPSASGGAQDQVPLPQEEDLIRAFFNLIGEKRVSGAVAMMSEDLVGDEGQKQTWGAQFNAMKSVKVAAVEKSSPEEWTEDRHTYAVTLDLVMDPASANTPIPYYGYENGQNLRWLTLQKINNQWQVASIATGP